MKKFLFLVTFIFFVTWLQAQTPQELGKRIDKLTVQNQVEHAELRKLINAITVGITDSVLVEADTTWLATRYWVTQNFMQKFYVNYGTYPGMVDGWVYKNDTVYVDTSYTTGGAGLPDSLFVNYGCNILLDVWFYSGDTLTIDTCRGGAGDNLGNHIATQPITSSTDTIILDDEIVAKQSLLFSKDNAYTPTIYFYMSMFDVYTTDIGIGGGDSNLWIFAPGPLHLMGYDSEVTLNDDFFGDNVTGLGTPLSPWYKFFSESITDFNSQLFFHHLPISFGDTILTISNDSVGKRYIDFGSFINHWSRTGNYVHLTVPTDSVGIGKTNPDEILDIVGNIQIDTTNAAGTSGVIKQYGTTIFQSYPYNVNPSYRNYFFAGAGGYHAAGTGNIGIGPGALGNTTNNDGSIAIGHSSQQQNASGSNCVTIGYWNAISVNNMQYSNIIGAWAGQNSGSRNQLFGSSAGRYMKGNDNIGIGDLALYQGSSGGTYGMGVWNIALGTRAHHRWTDAGDVTESANITIGYYAAEANGYMEGDSNLVISHYWGQGITGQSDRNLFLMTGENRFDSITEFDNNIVISNMKISTGLGLRTSGTKFQNRLAIGGNVFDGDSTSFMLWGNLLTNNLKINGTLSADLDSAASAYSVFYNKVTKEFTYDSTGTATISLPDIILQDPLPNSDHTATGTGAILTAGETVAFADLCYIGSNGKLYKVDANDNAKVPGMYICAEPAGIVADATGTFLSQGYVRDDSWNFTTGGQNGMVYTSETAGAVTQTAPTTSLAWVQAVGQAISADVLYFKPDLLIFQLE